MYQKNINLNHNITERMNKFRIGLSSANSISNNDPIIPNRPTSNFIFGGNKLWENSNLKNNNNDIIFEKNLSVKPLNQKN